MKTIKFKQFSHMYIMPVLSIFNIKSISPSWVNLIGYKPGFRMLKSIS